MRRSCGRTNKRMAAFLLSLLEIDDFYCNKCEFDFD